MASVKEFVYCLIISPPFGSDLQPAQRIDPTVADRERASSKVWSTRPPSFLASWHRYIVSTRVLNIKNLVLSAYIRDVGTEKGGEMKEEKKFVSAVRPRGTDEACVIQVIRTKSLVGAGTHDDLSKIMVQYWDFEGNLLATSYHHTV